MAEALVLRFEAPAVITRLCIHKGAIAIDGVSLTLNAVDDVGVEVCLIPHTLERTHLTTLAVGARVNLEADLVGKYVERLLRGRAGAGAEGGAGVTWETLARAGFVDDGDADAGAHD